VLGGGGGGWGRGGGGGGVGRGGGGRGGGGGGGGGGQINASRACQSRSGAQLCCMCVIAGFRREVDENCACVLITQKTAILMLHMFLCCQLYKLNPLH